MKRLWLLILIMMMCGGSSSSRTYAYDVAGRQTAYTHNDVNEYTRISGGSSPQHDAAGNLTTTENGYRLAYDHENRLVEVKAPAPDNTVLASYTYDALGHRIKQVKDNQTTRYYYDGETVLAEYDGTSGDLLRYHIHGPTYIDEHIALNEQETDYYYLLGPLHSVTGLADSHGKPVERYRYDAYGQPTWLGFGNFNNDEQIDLKDFLVFQKSFSGDQPCSEAGNVCDANSDGKVDLADFQAFEAGLTRTGKPLSTYRFTGQRLDFHLTDATGRRGQAVPRTP